ncbi:MAG: hypothetical protein GEV08_23810 [Acidimicrobiia bacterium]|nr:hypothetical protein [Acidimicrobiia bacterium]
MELDEDRLRLARDHGEADARRAEEHAPTDALERIAWAVGFGQVDQVQAAVDAARAAGLTWRQIAPAIGEHWRNVQTKYGGGRERHRRYRERKRQQGDGGAT